MSCANSVSKVTGYRLDDWG